MQADTKPKPKVLGAETVKVAGLMSYQDGSIVSHEIVRKATGTVTVFAFDEGQSLSEHTAPFDALVQVLEKNRNHHCRQSTSCTRRRDDSHAGTATARAQGAAMLQDDSHDDSVLNSPHKLSLSHPASRLFSIDLIERPEGNNVLHMNLLRSGSSPSYQTNAIAAASQLIKNRLGLHARPAAMFVRVANKHRAKSGSRKMVNG